MKILYPLFILSLLLFSFGCGDIGPKLESLDLMSQGLPIKINAPANSEVKFDDLGIMKDVTIKGDGNYHVQIYSSTTDMMNSSDIIKEVKSEVENSTYFSKIVSEDENGFVFEKQISEDYVNYDFRLIKLRGNIKYSFQAGFGNQYTLDEVKVMYKAVK